MTLVTTFCYSRQWFFDVKEHILRLEIIIYADWGYIVEKIVKEPKVSRAASLFFIALLGLVLIGGPVQYFFELWGLAITEFLLIFIAVLFIKTRKWDLKEVFPMRRPKLRQLLAVLVSWWGTLLGMLLINQIIMYFFPVAMAQTEGGLTDLFKTLPLPLSLFIVAVLPAIGEEILFRGAIQYNFKDKNKWATVLCVGLLFGLFHLDPTRILGTALLGMVATYIMYETKNLVLPMFLHLVNNAFGISATFLSGDLAHYTISHPVTALSSMFMASWMAPLLILAGSRLLKTKEERLEQPISNKVSATVIVLCLVILAGGIIVPVIADFEPVFQMNFSNEQLTENIEHIGVFSPEKMGKHMLELAVQCENAETSVVMTNGLGETVYSLSGDKMRDSGWIDLTADDYVLTINCDYDGVSEASVYFEILIY